MKKIINTISGNPVEVDRVLVNESNRQWVCNYQNNYYGDQICVARDSLVKNA